MKQPSLLWAVALLTLFFVSSCSSINREQGALKSFSKSSYVTGEFRGVWLRPPQKIEEIPLILDRIQKAGFNVLFLETLYHGHVIFPGSPFPERPEYKGRGVLQIFIREAHQRGIAVHCWTEVFYLQVDTEKYPQFPEAPLFKDHPEWLLLTREGQRSDVSESAHIFGDPANPGLRNFLLAFYKDLAARYDIDGINLDYIRYSAGSRDTGYTACAREAFRSEAGIDPKEIDREKNPDLWMRWVKWREDQVTNFVLRVSGTVKEIKPDMILSTAVFPEYYKTRGDHVTFQDWAAWLETAPLDLIIPMAYASSLEGIRGEIREVIQRNPRNTWIIPALALSTKTGSEYQAPDHPPIFDQIALVRSLKLKGHSVFCYDWILQNPKGFEAFKKVY